MATSADADEVLKFKGAFYQRPEHVKVPTVWMRFEGRTPREDGNYPKFRIEDVTDDYVEEIIGCFGQFAKEVPVNRALIELGVGKEHLDQSRDLWMMMLKDNVSLQCVTDDEETPRLVGFNVNEVATIMKPSDLDTVEGQHPEATKLLSALIKLKNNINVFELWNVDKYLDAWGLFVKPEFRGQGVAYYLLDARKPLCKALGLKATANGFGADAASRVAAKVGFETLQSISLEEFQKVYDLQLPALDGKGHLTFMGMKIE